MKEITKRWRDSEERLREVARTAGVRGVDDGVASVHEYFEDTDGSAGDRHYRDRNPVLQRDRHGSWEQAQQYHGDVVVKGHRPASREVAAWE